MMQVYLGATLANVNPYLMLAVCSAESDFRNVINKYDGGSPSYGVCQIKYGTAKMMGYKGSAGGLMDPVDNAYYASRYVAYQYRRYNKDLACAISAYNAGRCIKSNQKTYVKRVMDRLLKFIIDYNQYEEDVENIINKQGDTFKFLADDICQSKYFPEKPHT